MRGSLRRRGESWSLIYDLEPGTDGRRKQRTETFKGTKQEAEKELTRIINAINQGKYAEPRKMTLAEFLKSWLEESAKHTLSGKTYQEYERIVRRNLIPALGRVALQKLSPSQVQAYYSSELDAKRADGTKLLAPRTVLHHHRVLHRALRHAVKMGLLYRNPTDNVDPPKVPHIEMKTLNIEQVCVLLEAAAQNERLSIIVPLAVTTGLRRGELLGLRWSDISLETGTLTVRRTLEHVRSSGLRYKEPKTAKGRRTVSLPLMSVEALINHREVQNLQRREFGSAYQNNDLVCARPDGSPMPPDSISNNFPALLKRANLPHIRFHDLRHSCASILLAKGVHPKVVSERLGHSTTAITLDTYSHVLPNLQRDAADKIEEALRPRRPEADS